MIFFPYIDFSCEIAGRQADHLTIMSDPENSSVAVASAATTEKTNVVNANDNNEETATKTGTSKSLLNHNEICTPFRENNELFR